MPNHFWSIEREQTKKRVLAGTAPVCPALSKGEARTGRLTPASRCRVVPAALQAAKFGPRSPTRTGTGSGVTVSERFDMFWSVGALPSGTGEPQLARQRASRRAERRMAMLVARRARKIYAAGR